MTLLLLDNDNNTNPFAMSNHKQDFQSSIHATASGICWAPAPSCRSRRLCAIPSGGMWMIWCPSVPPRCPAPRAPWPVIRICRRWRTAIYGRDTQPDPWHVSSGKPIYPANIHMYIQCKAPCIYSSLALHWQSLYHYLGIHETHFKCCSKKTYSKHERIAYDRYIIWYDLRHIWSKFSSLIFPIVILFKMNLLTLLFLFYLHLFCAQHSWGRGYFLKHKKWNINIKIKPNHNSISLALITTDAISHSTSVIFLYFNLHKLHVTKCNTNKLVRILCKTKIKKLKTKQNPAACPKYCSCILHYLTSSISRRSPWYS